MLELPNILGLGYSGTAHIGGLPLLLLGSSAVEQDNYLRSQGAIANVINLATGDIPVLNRRSLNVNLTTYLSTNALQIIWDNFIIWRQNNFRAKSTSFEVYPANAEGYIASGGFINSATINSPEGQLGTVNFNIITYLWEDLTDSGPPPRLQTLVDPIQPELQPIPNWLTSFLHSGMPGTPLGFTLTFNNGYQYAQLCEATPGPPTPRIVIADRLSIELNCTTLAEPNYRPTEQATNVKVSFGGGSAGPNEVPLKSIIIPFCYRDPQRTMIGLGEPNIPIKWTAAWKAIGVVPSITDS